MSEFVVSHDDDEAVELHAVSSGNYRAPVAFAMFKDKCTDIIDKNGYLYGSILNYDPVMLSSKILMHAGALYNNIVDNRDYINEDLIVELACYFALLASKSCTGTFTIQAFLNKAIQIHENRTTYYNRHFSVLAHLNDLDISSLILMKALRCKNIVNISKGLTELSVKDVLYDNCLDGAVYCYILFNRTLSRGLYF